MPSLLNDIPSGPLLIALAAYHPIQTLMQAILHRVNPGLYATLAADRRAKLDPYFVFYAGILITTLGTPICLEAYRSTPAATDVFGADRHVTPAGQICLGSRAVLWVSELPLLAYSPEYLLHHVLSLSALVAVLARGAVLRPLYLIYAGLVTELLSDTVAILRHHGHTTKTSRPFARLVAANAVAVLLLRVVPGLYVMYLLSADAHLAWAAPVTFYTGYMLYCSWRQLSGLGYLSSSPKRPINLHIGSLIIPLFSILFGTAMAAAQISTAVIYASYARPSSAAHRPPASRPPRP